MTLLALAPTLLAAALLLGLACAGAALILWTLIADRPDLLTHKPWNCPVCLSSYPSALGGVLLAASLWDHAGAWSVAAGLLVSGSAVTTSVLVLKLKLRLET